MTTHPPADLAAPISAKTLAMLFEFTFNVTRANVEGFSHEDSLRQPPAGNCLNWLLGHIVATRQHTLELLGVPAINVPGLTAGNGMPLGVQIVAPFARDRRALMAAAWLERQIAHGIA